MEPSPVRLHPFDVTQLWRGPFCREHQWWYQRRVLPEHMLLALSWRGPMVIPFMSFTPSGNLPILGSYSSILCFPTRPFPVVVPTCPIPSWCSSWNAGWNKRLLRIAPLGAAVTGMDFMGYDTCARARCGSSSSCFLPPTILAGGCGPDQDE